MNWQQITVLVIVGAELGLALGKHGKPRDGTHSFGIALVSYAIWMGILISGGFFK